MTTIYKNSEIPSEYNIMVPSDSYYDLYKTSVLQPNENYDYYRVFYTLNEDIFVHNNRYNYNTITYLQGTQVNTSDNYIYRHDYKDIVFVSGAYILMFLFLVNIVTSLIKKNGILSGLL